MGAFVKRKLLLVCWLFGGLQSLDWEKVATPAMMSLMPDMTDQLALLSEWTPIQVSYFLFRRSDRFPFATMWPCLFKDCVDENMEGQALRFMESGAYVAQARFLRESTGVEHHPANIFKVLFQERELQREKF